MLGIICIRVKKIQLFLENICIEKQFDDADEQCHRERAIHVKKNQ